VKCDVENLSATRVKLIVELPAAELQPYINEAFKKISSQVNIPGFRRGKVPARIIEQRLGRGAVLEEAINAAVPKTYEAAIAESGVVPVNQPTIDVTEIAENDDVSFTAEVDIRPEFELPDYSAIEVTVDPAVVTDEDVAEQLDNLRGRFATLVDVDRPAARGDLVLVDITGEVDGVEIEEMAGQAISFEVGGQDMIPGFTEAVAGTSEGETAEFKFVPEAGEHEGKDVNVRAVVTKVRERNLPAADDDFASLASEFDTIDELTADIRARLGRIKRLEQGMQARAKVHDSLLESVDIPVPQSLLDAELADHFQDGHGDEDHHAEFEGEALARIRSMFILDKIAETEQLSVSQEEINAWVVQQSSRYQMTPDQFASALVQAGQVQMAVSEARRGKALAFVMEKVVIRDTDGTAVDLGALDADLQTSS
jgi:trigger factor